MYKSPIEIIANAGQMFGIEFDENVMKLVARYGIRIDKEELLKALQYDRDQYRKGFEDGWIASQKDAVEVVRCGECRWGKPYDRNDGQTGYYCGFCGHSFKYGTNWERIYEPIKESDDFCSYGERRSEDD